MFAAGNMSLMAAGLALLTVVLCSSHVRMRTVCGTPTTLAGIASSILLFVAIIATMVCCFMCSCCYLYQRRQLRGRTPYDAQHIPMASYPVEPMYDAYGKPLGPSQYLHAGFVKPVTLSLKVTLCCHSVLWMAHLNDRMSSEDRAHYLTGEGSEGFS
ncbi:hypothetical protein F7725_017298 [Dissostichus mawsoni]|uniref:Uncharacterized protein n=1 Tax=Dissostichus mawsoni TaxID=36200 RepID=A0A7J5Z406_DISMA|nr:hypothetical protein F7725_017298 [Dissostichus mawsoni]